MVRATALTCAMTGKKSILFQAISFNTDKNNQ